MARSRSEARCGESAAVAPISCVAIWRLAARDIQSRAGLPVRFSNRRTISGPREGCCLEQEVVRSKIGQAINPMPILFLEYERLHCGAAHWAAPADPAGLLESSETFVLGQAAGLVGRRGP